jgi:general secretion pathway protein E
MQIKFVGWLLFVMLLAGQLAMPRACAQGPNDQSGPGAAAGQQAQSANFVKRIQGETINWRTAVKTGLLALLILAWVKTGDWVNYDTQIFRFDHRKWNFIIFFPFALLAIGFFFFPVPFAIRFSILAVVWLATLIPYIVVHNKNVEPHQTVLTGAWMRYEIAHLASKVGIKISAERQAAYEKGAAVDLIAMGGADASEDNANLITARHSPGYVLLKELFAEAVGRRADRILLDYTHDAVNLRHEIDGVWHNGEPRERQSGDIMLAVAKTLANLDAKQRKQKQTGHLGAKFEGHSYFCTCTFLSQGTKTGERVSLALAYDKSGLKTYKDLGMREGLRDRWSEIMARDQGLVILASLPGGGLTTVTDISLEETDRLMRDFVSIEEVNHRNREIQNVTVHTYDTAAGQTPDSILPELIRTYPNVYVIRDIVNRETAKLLLAEVQDDHLMITTVRSRDAAEALLRMLQMKVPSQEFSEQVTAVLYQRLIRLLCPDCKVGYQPSTDVLRKLGIPAGKIQQLFRPPKPEEINKPCKTCDGLAYKGRTGLFELMEVTDPMREILAKQPNGNLLRKVAKTTKQRSLQEEGILMVAKGITSIAELTRVLKQ